MGREAVAIARWRGAAEEVKAFLESQEIILRGAIRARFARSGISDVVAEGNALALRCNDETLMLELGEAEALKWRDALLKPPPSLSDKLGIGPNKRACVIGEVNDPELVGALASATCIEPGDAAVLLAIVMNETGLLSAFAEASRNPHLALWCIYPKGKDASIGDKVAREFMRSSGYMDNKSCAVSARLTATRYSRKP